MMLVKIIRRARELITQGVSLDAATPELDFFLKEFQTGQSVKDHLPLFCRLDDNDILSSIKNWSHHPDKILSMLCRSLVERRLFKVRFQAKAFEKSWVDDCRKKTATALGLTGTETDYFVFTGEASNTTYDPQDERIHILFKDGTIRDISEVDNALIQHNLSGAVRKHYICYYRL
jgi:hypothetical protein